MRTTLTTFFATIAIAACATAPQNPLPLKPGTDWVANDAGWGEEAEAVFAEATAHVTAISESRAPKSWAVVLDVDETVLNNVEYQVRLDRAGLSYTSESWHDWTAEKTATLVPGAKPFIETVNELGGHVALVTNRSDTEQLWTEENLASVGLERNEDFRVLLTRARPDGASDKTPRFNLVPAMLAAQGYPGVEIVAFVGDNVGDKPADLGAASFFCIDQGAMYGEPCAEVPGPGR